ncbi:MAG: hypothetical protein ACE1ZG_04115 [Gammaproteobacteria bacterium]
MDVIATDVCAAHGFRLTEFQITNGNEVIDTFFCIRDEHGNRHGQNYDTVEEPLKILLNMSTTKETKQNSA